MQTVGARDVRGEVMGALYYLGSNGEAAISSEYLTILNHQQASQLL